jgi:PAS domain S-box-containing protein
MPVIAESLGARDRDCFRKRFASQNLSAYWCRPEDPSYISFHRKPKAVTCRVPAWPTCSNLIEPAAFTSRLKPKCVSSNGEASGYTKAGFDLRRHSGVAAGNRRSLRSGGRARFGSLVARIALDPYVEGAQYITFFPVVIFAALVIGIGAGFVCAAVSIAAALFFLMEPRFSFSIGHPGDVIGFLLFSLVLLAQVIIGAGMRFAVEQYRELNQTLEQRVNERTAEVVQRGHEIDQKNRQLYEANEEMTAMYERGGIFLGRLTLEGALADANYACIEGLGFARADNVGKPFWEGGWWRISPEVEEWIRKRVEQALAGEPSRGEVSYVTGYGEERVTDVSMMPIKDDSDRVVFVFVAGLDVTERARQYQATFENAAVGIAHASADLKYTRVNEAMCRIIGYPANELMEKLVLDFVHPKDREPILVDIGLVRDGKIDSYDAERRYVHKNGTTVWIRSSVSALRKGDGSVDHFIGVFQDISGRKRAEEELRKSEERFKTAILRAPVPVALFDDQERILAVNQSWVQQSAYPRDELRTIDDWRAHAYGERSRKVPEYLRELIATEPEVRKAGLAIRTGEGFERHWSFVGSALGTQSDGRHLFISMAQDTTDRKAYEERIEMLMREAKHRVKNLLGLVQAVARQTAGESEQFVESFTERIQALAATQDLLAGNQGRGADVDDLVRAQLAHFANLVGPRIAVRGPKLRLTARCHPSDRSCNS